MLFIIMIDPTILSDIVDINNIKFLSFFFTKTVWLA